VVDHMQRNRTDLLAQVAVWYYEDRLDQAEIAQRIGKSRSMVSRMLNEVRERGMVEIRIKYPLKRNTQLETACMDRFGLTSVWILNNPPDWSAEMRLRMLGRTAASCLQRYLRDGVRIGVAWSRTLRNMVMELSEQAIQDALVVQISGSVSTDNPTLDGPELVRILAQKIGGDYRYFPAPLVVRDPDIRRSLLRESTISEAMRLAESIDVAVCGIGTISADRSSLRSSGLIDDISFREIMDHHAVGDIIAHHFDRHGKVLPIDFNDRVIGLDPDRLKRVPNVIAVSAGEGKAMPILAAIRGGWFNVLVSDSETIEVVLALADEEEGGVAG
jgi:deoxyribonucleoside regulator